MKWFTARVSVVKCDYQSEKPNLVQKQATLIKFEDKNFSCEFYYLDSDNKLLITLEIRDSCQIPQKELSLIALRLLECLRNRGQHIL